MTNEDIERKCLEYSQAATPSYINGDFDRYAVAQACEEGAKWRINASWHDASEIPQIYGEYENDLYPQIPCLVLGHLSTGYGYGVRYWNVTHQVWDDEECDDFECKMDAIEKWAYLDDLLPTNEEQL